MNLRLKSISKVLYACILFFAISGQADAAIVKININIADAQQLIQLKYVGTSYADRIIQYRKQNGLFTAPEEIMKVKGIGKKIYEANKDIIVVSEEEPEK